MFCPQCRKHWEANPVHNVFSSDESGDEDCEFSDGGISDGATTKLNFAKLNFGAKGNNNDKEEVQTEDEDSTADAHSPPEKKQHINTAPAAPVGDWDSRQGLVTEVPFTGCSSGCCGPSFK